MLIEILGYGLDATSNPVVMGTAADSGYAKDIVQALAYKYPNQKFGWKKTTTNGNVTFSALVVWKMTEE